MFKKKKKKIIIIEKMWVLLKIKKKILNLIKNKPTGGNPVKQKNNQRYRFLKFLYFWINNTKLFNEKVVITVFGSCENVSLKILNIINI